MGAYTVPTNVLNNTVEAKAAAKKLGAETQAATEQAKKAEKKPVQAATKPAAATQADTKQKIKKQAATGQQKTAAKEGAPPVKRCTVSFTGACVVLVSAAVFFATTMARRSNSSMSTGAAEVVTTKSASSWADASNDQLCDNGVRNFIAVQEAFETTYSADAVPDDAAKGFGRSASLDAAAAEGAKPCGKTEEGVAYALWWMPVILGVHDTVPSGNRVVTTATRDGGDVDDGTPHRDLTSHQPAEQPTPADIRLMRLRPLHRLIPCARCLPLQKAAR